MIPDFTRLVNHFPLTTFIATNCLARDLWLFNSRREPGTTITAPLPSKKKIITRSLSWTPWSLARTILSLLRFIENQLILDFYSHHEKRHKISAAETLLYRATNLPNTKQGKETERNHVTDSLRFNYYPQKAISNILKRKYLLLSVQTPSQHLRNLFAFLQMGHTLRFL